MRLESVVPWGRSYDEYVAMFDLSPEDLELRILDCAGGPSSFNAELSQRGGNVVSADPIYRFTAEQIEGRIAETCPVVLSGLEANRERCMWERAVNPVQLAEHRMSSMRIFLDDYSLGHRQGRYHPVELPVLPFRDKSFGLSLCSHFLFTYSEFFSLEFHVLSVMDMCRTAREARIFPLLDLSGSPSPHLGPLLSDLEKQGYQAEVRRVPYEFQVGGCEMLRVRPPGPH